ncbi:MAG TPA: glycerophosphodiester phosphodiesterase [Burkholderiaceae bacterium]|nr:glycerophosphodiester phosphodiesterase [Burkholderiaceae bacterium]
MRACWLIALLATGGPGIATAFDLEAHRGGRGVAPENTLPAFAQALAAGVTTLETDLALTRDGVLVLSHDPYLNPVLTRGPDGRWLEAKGPVIRSLTLEQLSAYDVGRLNPDSEYARLWPDQRPADGARVPTLAALFTLARERRVRFNIETKLTPDDGDAAAGPATFAGAVVDTVRRAGMSERVVVQSFDWRTLIEVNQLAPEIATSCLTAQTATLDTVRPEGDGASRWHAGLRAADHGESLIELVRAAGCSIWSPFWGNLTPELLAEAHAARLKVVPWTVNDPETIEALAALGVDGLITDYPERARRILTARGVAIE